MPSSFRRGVQQLVRDILMGQLYQSLIVTVSEYQGQVEDKEETSALGVTASGGSSRSRFSYLIDGFQKRSKSQVI